MGITRGAVSLKNQDSDLLISPITNFAQTFNKFKAKCGPYIESHCQHALKQSALLSYCCQQGYHKNGGATLGGGLLLINIQEHINSLLTEEH